MGVVSCRQSLQIPPGFRVRTLFHQRHQFPLLKGTFLAFPNASTRGHVDILPTRRKRTVGRQTPVHDLRWLVPLAYTSGAERIRVRKASRGRVRSDDEVPRLANKSCLSPHAVALSQPSPSGVRLSARFGRRIRLRRQPRQYGPSCDPCDLSRAFLELRDRPDGPAGGAAG